MLNQLELSLAVIAAILFMTGTMLWRGSRTRQQIAKRDPLSELAKERLQQEQTPEGKIHQMEVRLFDYGREVEGRINTSLALLDRLVLDADAEIRRLEELLSKTEQQERESSTPLTSEILSRIPALRQAGLTDEEIARCLQCSLDVVQHEDNPSQDAA